MNRIDLTPLFRNSIGFDRFASLLDTALSNEPVSPGYPPYNIEMLEENKYAITIAVAGFTEAEIDIQVENGVLTVRGKKEKTESGKYLHKGIANRAFERKFNLADHVEVVNADLEHGLLNLSLVREIPEAIKPKKIAINRQSSAIHQDQSSLSQKAV